MDKFIRGNLDNPTFEINQAIKAVNENGGGIVYIDGIYECSSIEILDNVYLYLEKNSKLILSSNLDSFYDININRNTILDRPSWENCDYNGKPSKYFIYAINKKNCGIIGNGTIDGNEKIFYGDRNEHHIEGAFYPRIPLIYFENCNNIKFLNIRLQNSAFWTLHLVGSNEILVDSITIDNNLIMTNSDGIDPDHCKNMTIKNCNISCADDCIVFKSTEAFIKYGDTENINVSNCNLRSTCAAIKFGSESFSDMHNINIKDCNISSSNRGISLMLRDCGNLYDIKFNNIKIETKRFSPLYWWGKAEPIAITAIKRYENTNIGYINNICFNNINADSENGILIYGMNNISNIELNHINVLINNKTSFEKNIIDLRPSILNILDGDSFVLYSRSCKNLIMNDFNYKINENMKKYIKKAIDIE